MPPGAAAVRVLVAVVAVVAVMGVLLWAGQRRLIYLPDTSTPPPASDILPGARDVRLHTSDGLELGAWFVPAAVPTGPGAGFTVLLAPGNGGNRLDRAPLAAALSGAGFATLLMDYRGYGGNPGRPTEAGLALDARAARQFLLTGETVPPERLLYLGESLGTGVAAELAAAHPPAGLLLRSPFVDLPSVARHHYPLLPTVLVRDRFPVAATVARLEVPVTVVHGTADTIVPSAQSERVADAAPHLVERVVLPGTGHNDPPMFGQPVVDALVRLAEAVRS
ncbi:alpha/beta hydrolase [Rhodococcus phenolicus]|uniref:alpha/beta hydrolase n=1 Tax=Rhodococcus phenolicus TaxID=263849 RepID=UPI00082B84B5|nr:alpha/beta hydrolase [Rhodococcus phenolicus]